MKLIEGFPKANLTTALALAVIFLVTNAQTKKSVKKKIIGTYIIPQDPLQDTYCRRYNIKEMHRIKEVQTDYNYFFLKKVKEMQEPMYNFIKTNKWVKKLIQKNLLKKQFILIKNEKFLIFSKERIQHHP